MHCQDSAAPNASPARSLGLDASLQNQPRLSSRTKVPPQICSQYKSHKEMDLQYNHYIPKHYLFNSKCTEKNMISKSNQEPANIQKNDFLPQVSGFHQVTKDGSSQLGFSTSASPERTWPAERAGDRYNKPPFSLGNVEKCGWEMMLWVDCPFLPWSWLSGKWPPKLVEEKYRLGGIR